MLPMKKLAKATIFIMSLILFSCSQDEENINDMYNSNTARQSSSSSIVKNWDFNDLNEWQDASQNSKPNYFIENGNLKMFTNPNTWERTKIKSISTYTTGSYTWNVYAPEMGIGDMTSIGAFLYSDDTHELDFEIGYGNQSLRNELGAQDDDLVIYMTSQGNPALSVRKTIKRNQWYTLTLELRTNSKGKYLTYWKINGVTEASAQLAYGTKSKFSIFCSVENLQFIGDHIPQQQNYALFNSVQYNNNF